MSYSNIGFCCGQYWQEGNADIFEEGVEMRVRVWERRDYARMSNGHFFYP